jgi:biogenesis of lysosome-related organelles complex 1 subunit 4
LTHLEEFCGLLEVIRIDNTVCLEQVLQKVRQKSLTMEEVYAKIDHLEQFVEIVKKCVNEMEEDMNKAQQLLPKNRVKKFFNSILNSSSKQTFTSQQNFRYDAPYIFKTNDYIFKDDNDLANDQNLDDS